MSKKTYTSPEIEIELFTIGASVITTSFGGWEEEDEIFEEGYIEY